MAQPISLGWKSRLGILAGLGWLFVALIVSLDYADTFGVFMLIGVVPIALIAGAAWVWAGYSAGAQSKTSHRRRRSHRRTPPADGTGTAATPADQHAHGPR